MADEKSSVKDRSAGDRQFWSLLIALYRDHPELWKVKSKEYLKKSKKCIALQKIVGVLKEYKPDFTVENVKQKINILRTNFNKENTRIEQSKRSGTSADDIVEPKLWYYNELLFIKEQVEIAETESSEQPSTTELQTSSSADEIATPPSKKIKKKDSSEQLVDLATAYFIRPQSESDLQDKGWAMNLNKIDPMQRRYAEKIINDTLFQAEMGTLTRYGVYFFTSSPSAPAQSAAPYRSPYYASTSSYSSPAHTPPTVAFTGPQRVSFSEHHSSSEQGEPIFRAHTNVHHSEGTGETQIAAEYLSHFSSM